MHYKGRSMELSKLSILSYGEFARVRYEPYSLFDITPNGIRRWKNMHGPSFIGDNGAVKVLRERCKEYPQNSKWMQPGAIQSKALDGGIVTVNEVLYYIHVHSDGLPYFMASYRISVVDETLNTSTLGRLTDDGLQLCAFVDKRAGVALDSCERPLVWRVK